MKLRADQTDDTAAVGEAVGSDEIHADTLSFYAPAGDMEKLQHGRGLRGGRGLSGGDELRYALVRRQLYAGTSCRRRWRLRMSTGVPRPLRRSTSMPRNDEVGAAPGLSGTAATPRAWTR